MQRSYKIEGEVYETMTYTKYKNRERQTKLLGKTAPSSGFKGKAYTDEQ